jgi:hypothetical protein
LPIAGFQRFRQWAFSAAQSAHGTAATPSGAFPWRGVPDIDPHWTDIDDVDVGSVDPVLSPYRTVTDISTTLAGPLDYNSIPLIMAAGVRGGVTATGAGPYTWTHQAVSLTATTLDEFSASWGDDFAQDDIRLRDGIIEQIEFTMPDDLGPWRVSTQWYFGNVQPHTTKPAVTLASNLPLVFGADTQLFINSTAGAIGNTQISDALHSARVTIRNSIDRKRFANGSNSRFAVSGYGFAGREIEAEFTFAKTTAIAGFASTSELRDWLNADPVSNYVEILATSAQIAGGSTAYSWSQRLHGTWRTKSDGEMGGNTTVTLTFRGQYDATLGYVYRSSVVNSNATLP